MDSVNLLLPTTIIKECFYFAVHDLLKVSLSDVFLLLMPFGKTLTFLTKSLFAQWRVISSVDFVLLSLLSLINYVRAGFVNCRQARRIDLIDLPL